MLDGSEAFRPGVGGAKKLEIENKTFYG